jgi:hypothetical protein
MRTEAKASPHRQVASEPFVDRFEVIVYFLVSCRTSARVVGLKPRSESRSAKPRHVDLVAAVDEHRVP